MIYDAIKVGGSYAGLSAALTLGRSRRKKLVIDAGKPRSAPTQHFHNFLTQDEKTPSEVANIAKSQVKSYPTVSFLTERYSPQKR